MSKKSTQIYKGVEQPKEKVKILSKNLNPKKTTLLVDKGVEITIPPVLQQKPVTIPSRPSRNRKQREPFIEECINAEKTKPWINGFEQTFIKLINNGDNNSLFEELIKNNDTEGEWYTPSDLFYKILCKESSVYSSSQSGSTLIVNKIASNQSVKLTVANKIKFGKKSYIIPENNDYKFARENYFKNKLDVDQDHIEILLSTKMTKIVKQQDIKSLRHKINKYVTLFSSKVPISWLVDLVKVTISVTQERNMTVKDLLEMIVNSTMFFRNEFDIVNKNLLMQIKKILFNQNKLYL